MDNLIGYKPGVRIMSSIEARKLKTTEEHIITETFKTLDELIGFCTFINGTNLFRATAFSASVTVVRK